MIAFVNDTISSFRLRRFLQFRRRLVFIPRGLELALLSANFSLHMAARLNCHGPLAAALPLVFFNGRCSPGIVTGASLGSWTGVIAYMSLSLRPCTPFLRGCLQFRGVFMSHGIDSCIPSRCLLADTHYINSWTRSRSGESQWLFFVAQS
jgi:hypothetical protein